MDARLNSYEEKMTKTMHNLDEEFGSIRAGRANPHVLDKIRVDYYGTPSPIQSVANVSVPEPRMIQIQPWEASLVKEIINYHATPAISVIKDGELVITVNMDENPSHFKSTASIRKFILRYIKT